MARAVIVGVAASPGVGLGRALIVATRSFDAPAHATARGGRSRLAPAREARRLRDALEATAAELSDLAVRIAPDTGPKIAAILEAQALMAQDPALVEPALAAVASGMSADQAVLVAAATQADRLDGLEDVRFRARAADVRDVGNRVARRLAGRASGRLWHADGTPAVIVAEDLAPSETATLRPDRVTGLALAGGAVSGHAAIVARALRLPLVLGLGLVVLGLAPGSTLIVDGSGGRVLVDPDTDEIPTARTV